MIGVEGLRQKRLKFILEDPVAVVFTRTPLVDDGEGGLMPGPEENVALTARLVEDAAAERELATLPATQHRSTRWVLICDHAADLRADPKRPDEFAVAGRGRFRVLEWIPRRHRAQVYGHTAPLLRIA